MREVLTTTPLHEAVERNDVDACLELLAAGADVNAKIEGGRPALLDAAVHGKVEICHLLLEYGADVGSRNDLGTQPLHDAAYKGHSDVCRLLLDYQADVNALDSTFASSLYWAVINNHTKVCRILVEAGADSSISPDGAPAWYLTPMQKAVQLLQFEQAALFVERCGEDPAQKTREGKTLRDLVGSVTTWHEIEREWYSIRTGVAVRDSLVDDGPAMQNTAGSIRAAAPL